MVLFIMHVAGAAALLIWAVRLVRTGVERAFAVPMRRWLRRSSRHPLLAAGSGTLAAMMLQSSTAVAILTANFTAVGTIAGPVGLAILLGADVGSALVVQVLLVQQDWLIPILLLGGVGLFLRSKSKTLRMSGRILIGLALVFVSLSMIREATEPLRDSSGLAVAMRYLSGDPVTAFAIGALFAWAVHSSVAAVLLVVTLVSQGLLPMPAAVAMVLGANLGGSIIAYVLTLGAAVEARRVIVANVILRGGGAAAALAALTFLAPPLDLLGATAGQQIINLHLAFNLVIALVGLPLIHPAIKLMTLLIAPPSDAGTTLKRVSALDPSALDKPERALACAAREILRIGEEIETMLRSVIGLYAKWDDSTAQAIRDAEQVVDRMHFDTKLYLARLHRGQIDDDIAHRSMELSTMAVNLESAGDAIARNMLGQAQRMENEGIRFSDTGWREICDFHDRVLSNAQAALNVLMTLNPDAARALVEEKERVRAIEQDLQRSHLDRLRQGRHESIETSNIHQETLRALKQVNTAFSMVAYPILAETGDLLASRLAHQGKS